MKNNNIFLFENIKQDFSDLQKFIIGILSKDNIQFQNNSNNTRTLILINNKIPSLFLNIRATLWYYNGFSYPHLSSDDDLVDESFIVITTKIEYLINNIHKFNRIISIYNNISLNHILLINKTSELYIVEINIKDIESNLIQSKIKFFYKKINDFDNLEDFNESDNINQENKNDKIEYDYPSDNMNINKYQHNLYNNIFKGMNINNNKDDASNDRALFIIKPRAIKIRMEFILLNKLLENGFLVLKYFKRKLSKEFWIEFYKNISHKDFFDSYCTYLASDFVGLALIYNKNDVFSKIRSLIGPTNPKDCKPFHLRYQFGIDLDDNGMHASDSIDSFKYEMEVLKNFKIIF